MKHILYFSLACMTPLASAQDTPQPNTTSTEVSAELLSVRQEIKLAIQRGNNFLKSTQKTEGFWQDENLPAYTSLAVYAAMIDPNREQGETPEHISKAYKFIESKAHKDGGIYGKGLATYNTSLAIMALAASENKEHVPLIKNARHFLVNLQTAWKPNPDGEENIMNGGIGYGGTYPHSDMSNTHLALHAIRTADQFIEEGEKLSADLDWEAAQQFISSCQNLESTNPLPNTGNDGSFIYFPGNSKAGLTKSESGRDTLKGYGSMSYAGLLSLIHAKVDANDPRVEAVKQWLSNNYTLEENPGMGKQGLFYYYHTMAKALSAANIQKLPLKDGTFVDWRKELANKLLQLQREDGSWINKNARWLESEPDLVSAYVVITLSQIYHSIPK